MFEECPHCLTQLLRKADGTCAPTPTQTDPPKGDVNGDGNINIVDDLLTAQYYVDLDP